MRPCHNDKVCAVNLTDSSVRLNASRQPWLPESSQFLTNPEVFAQLTHAQSAGTRLAMQSAPVESLYEPVLFESLKIAATEAGEENSGIKLGKY